MTATLCGPAATVRRAGVRARTFQGARFLPSEVYQTQRPAPRCPAASFCEGRAICARSHQHAVSVRVALTPALSRKREREPAASRGDAWNHLDRGSRLMQGPAPSTASPLSRLRGRVGVGASRAQRRRPHYATRSSPSLSNRTQCSALSSASMLDSVDSDDGDPVRTGCHGSSSRRPGADFPGDPLPPERGLPNSAAGASVSGRLFLRAA